MFVYSFKFKIGPRRWSTSFGLCPTCLFRLEVKWKKGSGFGTILSNLGQTRWICAGGRFGERKEGKLEWKFGKWTRIFGGKMGTKWIIMKGLIQICDRQYGRDRCPPGHWVGGIAPNAKIQPNSP